MTAERPPGGGLKVTPYKHRGCGGVIVASLDGDSCAICGTEIASEDEFYATRSWPYDGARGRGRLTGNLGVAE